ncbi:MAG: VWA domain-containing protein [Roseiflexaceae bacterium]
MSFIWPVMLILLLLIPVCVVLYMRLQQRRRRLAASYGSMGLVQAAAGRSLGVRRHIPPVLFLVALAILIIALARPQTTVSVPRVEGTVLLTFDVSGSMAAEDLAPNRMEAAKVAARAFVEQQPRSVQIGVLAFSDSGLAIQAPTNDQAAILAAINRLSPQRGTSLGQGILAALNTIATTNQPPERMYTNLTPTPAALPTPVPDGTFTSATIVLLTDGENNENPNPLEVAQIAADRGVRIYTIGIGSTTGTTLHVNGFTVHTALDEPMLQQIAQVTEGDYYHAASGDDLRAIYENLGLQLVIKPEDTEVTALFAGAGMLILLIGGICSMLWLSRVP